MSISCPNLSAKLWHQIDIMSNWCLKESSKFWHQIDKMSFSCRNIIQKIGHQIDMLLIWCQSSYFVSDYRGLVIFSKRVAETPVCC